MLLREASTAGGRVPGGVGFTETEGRTGRPGAGRHLEGWRAMGDNVSAWGHADILGTDGATVAQQRECA